MCPGTSRRQRRLSVAELEKLSPNDSPSSHQAPGYAYSSASDADGSPVDTCSHMSAPSIMDAPAFGLYGSSLTTPAAARTCSSWMSPISTTRSSSGQSDDIYLNRRTAGSGRRRLGHRPRQSGIALTRSRNDLSVPERPARSLRPSGDVKFLPEREFSESRTALEPGRRNSPVPSCSGKKG